MENEIISYFEACRREKGSLQRGMNYRMGGDYSVLLMSIRKNAPYGDRIEDEGSTLIYEGHDVPRSKNIVHPKLIDQPEFNPSGTLTENGKFHKAAQDYKKARKNPERVRVYEKLYQGIWSYYGEFLLVDSWKENDGDRSVFKFKLVAVEEVNTNCIDQSFGREVIRRRIIPSRVKKEVWIRDGGKCVICGSSDDLHFDHIIPYSKGGTSSKSENIQILCARHNIEKRDKIE